MLLLTVKTEQKNSDCATRNMKSKNVTQKKKNFFFCQKLPKHNFSKCK